MAEELGRIDKPMVDEYRDKNKLYVVPLYISSPSMGKDYTEKFKRYWQQIDEHLTKLESKMGNISRIFHEAISDSGKEGLEIVRRISPDSHRISSSKIEKGALLEGTEDRELVLESSDWERLLMVGFTSQKVAEVVTDSYIKTIRSRYEHIVKVIKNSLKGGDAGVLFIREGHMIQFPNDIEVFSVSPPALDELNRYLREFSEKVRDSKSKGKEKVPTDRKETTGKKSRGKKKKDS
jgi:hypothetical protein